ncbi:protein SSUH2 homolog isoform X4 [Balearica regulorum gibbericeps]|uniref:protein SSUH2 homolog isoform X4 n=1 Tax=Balearica regulorum gibbericeps TaxID=100784 RepID=UPI003F5F6797
MEQEMKADGDPEPRCPLTPSAPLRQPGDGERSVTGRGAKPLPPPLDLVGEPGEQRSRVPFVQHSMPPMTEAAARRALLHFVASRCCYGSRAAGELAIRRLRQLGTYRYRLEMFSESRLSEWAFEPFTRLSQVPWSRPGQVRGVPRGRSDEVCNVQGIPTEAKAAKEMPALFRCGTCSGWGSKTCATCHGEKKLQHFKQLVITWKNNVFEFVSEHHLNFPGELLSKVSGENIFKDENVMVYPIINFPDPEISLASQRAIAEHSAAFARILRQRQTIELIPITEVHYQYAGKPYLYYIYGLENKVYALDYPERCCCGCTIV